MFLEILGRRKEIPDFLLSLKFQPPPIPLNVQTQTLKADTGAEGEQGKPAELFSYNTKPIGRGREMDPAQVGSSLDQLTCDLKQQDPGLSFYMSKYNKVRSLTV